MKTAEDFYARVDKTEACWLWTGAIAKNGYGSVSWMPHGSAERTFISAHRLSYKLSVGEIPQGLDLDHLCRVRSCVNPQHLEPVTRAENLRRGLRGSMTHCLRGHPFDEENTRIRPDGKGRVCRACHRLSERTRAMAKKGVAA